MSINTVDGFRLSVQQERVWSQQADSAAPFWAECELLIEGPVNVARLQEVFHAVVDRHEILRTAFHHQAGVKVPFQVILATTGTAWQTVDLSGLVGPLLRAQIDSIVRSHQSAFNVEKGTVLHVLLATLAPQRHTVVLSLPVLCADLRTMQNLIDEIGRSYSFDLAGEDDVMQYADIAEWQRELLASDDTRAGREFWRDYFRKLDYAASDSILSVFEKNVPGQFEPGVIVREISTAILASKRTILSADLLFACWHAFLSRMTGRPTLTIAREYDGRNYSELANALGLFSRYLPFQSTCPPEMSFNEFLQMVKRDSSEFQSWQDSFAWSQTELPSATDSALELPLAFDYVELKPPQMYGDLTITTVRQEACCERFDLKLSVLQQAEVLSLQFHFNSARIERSTIEYWSNCFLTLLTAAATKPETLVTRLPLLSETDRNHLLTEWNQTAAEYPSRQCIHELFEAQALRTPDSPAVRYQEKTLAYRELNERANRLAHALRSKGVGPDSLVALCVDRNIDMMTAVLAILKAGGAYVSLNAEHPKSRTIQQLAGATALLTEQKFAQNLPQFHGPVFLLDEPQQWTNQPSVNPETLTNSENLAYVIYTSGSTGTPKGVAVRHRNLVNYTTFIEKRLDLQKHPEPLQFATVSTLGADLGNTCIYPSLVSGGCLHVIGHDVAADSEMLREYMTQYPVDVLKIVPSHLMALLNSGGGRQVLPRKYLVMGGESLTASLMQKILDTGTDCEIFNHYGPTETTVGSLTLRLKDYDWIRAGAQTIPIGRPIANTQVFVLDAQLQPVPIGVTGELYIAGEGVTAGYLNDPERTAERFLPNPFQEDPAKRMYRTGDLTRYLPDGNVEFLGRVDDQVKIRGFRIELGEIEATLASHPDVKQTVVLARDNESGEKQLLAYVVIGSSPVASIDELRTYLKQHLPDYMVPAAIVILPKLPLTANGKIDRQALPAPEAMETAAYIAPQTPTEEVVASIWAEVLRRDRISTQDSFFDLGGHSLLATQVISRIRRALNVDIPLRTLFEAPTVAKIAEQIDNLRRDPLVSQIPPIAISPRNENLPPSFAQQRLWVLDQMEPNNPLYNIPRRVRMHGDLDVDALTRALNEIVRRHESQRTTFAVKNAQPVQVIAPTLVLDVGIRDLSGLPEPDRMSEARRIAEEEALTPFDLAIGPLLHASLLKLSSEDHILLLTMHHIVSDAWSAGIFFQEFSSLYESFVSGRPSSLPELTIQYADYAAWQRKWFQGEVLNNQLAYWRNHLQGAPPVLQLPIDRPRPKVQSFQGSHKAIPFSNEVLGALRKLGQQQGTTLFMTLLAGFQALLSLYSGEEQIVIGTDVANRANADTEQLIGFFINLLALRTDLSGNPTFIELLGRVREVALGAYAHQEMPFDKLVEELQPERSLSHNPLVQVLFVMQNIPRQKRELAGLRIEPFELPVTRSKFDLAVFMVDGEDGLIGYWLYSTDLFDEKTILRMAAHFENLLGNAVAQPETRLRALEILSDDEKQQRDTDKQQKKQSQLKKLLTSEPKAVSIPEVRN
jgi:amino acid adenylation domain-containing protein